MQGYIVVTFQKDLKFLFILFLKSLSNRKIIIVLPNKEGLQSQGLSDDNLIWVVFHRIFRFPIYKLFFWCEIKEEIVYQKKGLGYIIHEIDKLTQDYFVANFELDSNTLIADISKKYKTDKLVNFIKVKMWWSIFNIYCVLRYISDEKINANLVYNSSNISSLHFQKIWNQFSSLDNIVLKNKPKNVQRSNIIILYIYFLSVTLRKIVKLRFVIGREKYNYAVEAIWGLDFYKEKNTLFWKRDKLKKDIIFYSHGKPSSLREKTMLQAIENGYRHVTIEDSKINIRNLWTTFYYLHLLPGFVIVKNVYSRTNLDILHVFFRHFIKEFYDYYLFCSNFEFKVETNFIQHYGLSRVVAYNLWNSKVVSFCHSDMKQANFAESLYAPICDAYISFGACQNSQHSKIENLIELGYYLLNLNEKDRIRREVRQNLGISPDEQIISVFDETFGLFHMYTYETYTKFYEAVIKIAEQLPGVLVYIKQKYPFMYYTDKIDMSDDESKYLVSLHQILKNMNNVFYIPLDIHLEYENHDDPDHLLKDVLPEKLTLASNAVLTMHMHSPSTNANIFGIPGFYYCPSGLNPHPAAKKFYNKLVYTEEELLIAAIKDLLINKNLRDYAVDKVICAKFFGVRSNNAHDQLLDFMERIIA